MSFAILPDVEPVQGAPAPDRLLSGDPRFTTWNAYESADGKRFAGTWRCTPGAWRIVYDEWEYCEVIEGVGVITHDDGRRWTLKAGDRFVLEPGFTGSWEVVETMVKRYVVVL